MTNEVLLAIFHRRGGSGLYTKPFSELNIDAQSHICEAIRLASDEAPIIACYRSSEEWYLITGRSIYVRTTLGYRRVGVEEINDVSDALVESVRRGATGKESLSVLRLILGSGETMFLETEPGKPYVAVWNLLKSLARPARE